MSYALKLFGTELLKFDVIENLADPVVHILWLDESKKELLPLGMDATDKGLASWLKHRSIPKNRAYVNSFLAKCGLSANRPMDVILVCKGLSLNDSYWITDETFTESFESKNLYDNNFSRVLAWTASGASNTGNEPYSELYAYMVAERMDINAIPYRVAKWKGNLCSVCELFTNKHLSYVPVGRLIKSGGMKAVRQFYESLGQQFVGALDEMIVFDAVICNTDRHYGNFGVLVDSDTNKIVAPAPLFDHGNSLFNLAGEENWKSEKVLQNYVETLFPCVYDDFISEAKTVMNDEIKEKLRKLLTFDIKKTGKNNYSSKKLKIMNEIIKTRVSILLQN